MHLRQGHLRVGSMAGSGNITCWQKSGPMYGRFFAGIQASWQLATGPAGFKTFICPTPSPPPLQVHLFSLHTHTPLLSLHPDTRREGLSISHPTSNPLPMPDRILPA